ncbi:MAG: HU family DNA-binding protein [bacterium]
MINRKIAKKLGLTYKTTDQIVEASEKALFDLLLERGQVRIHGFGTFYTKITKSRTIKQIGTKKPRLLLEQKLIKFRSSPTFRDEIYGREKKPKKTVQSTEIKIENLQEAAAAKPTVSPTPKPKFSFKTSAFHPRVSHDKIQDRIKERWLKLAERKELEKPKVEVVREALIFGRLLRQIEKTGTTSISFRFTKDKIVTIYSGRPRRQISHLPREIVQGFLDFVDIREFHIPQERDLLLSLSETRDEKIKIHLHSFPIDSGASIQINIGWG